MIKNKPLIGIIANYTNDDEIGIKLNLGVHGQEWQLLPDDYVMAIEHVGGIPIILPITNDVTTLIPLIKQLDGIIFTGGPDIDPQVYGENPMPGLQEIDVKRDEYELALVHYVLERTKLPVLGICRGLQILTVATGGTLYQDITKYRKESFNHTVLNVVKHHPTHEVMIKKGSFFYEVFKRNKIGVNSFHHQAVKDLGKNFKATMVADDGVVEGIEMSGERLICAVQWHPESMFDQDPIYIELFSSFLKQC